jgi:hypothetical protein
MTEKIGGTLPPFNKGAELYVFVVGQYLEVSSGLWKDRKAWNFALWLLGSMAALALMIDNLSISAQDFYWRSARTTSGD